MRVFVRREDTRGVFSHLMTPGYFFYSASRRNLGVETEEIMEKIRKENLLGTKRACKMRLTLQEGYN